MLKTFKVAGVEIRFKPPATYGEIFFVEVEIDRLEIEERIPALFDWCVERTFFVYGFDDIREGLTATLLASGNASELIAYRNAIVDSGQLSETILGEVEEVWRRKNKIPANAVSKKACTCAFCRNPETIEQPEIGFTRGAKCIFGRASLAALRVSSTFSFLSEYPNLMELPPWFVQVAVVKSRIESMSESKQDELKDYNETLNQMGLPKR